MSSYDFILPETWAIEVNKDNRDMLNEYRKNIIKYRNFNIPEEYRYMDNDGMGIEVPLFYTIISTQEFIKYVFNAKTFKEESTDYLIEFLAKLEN